MVSALIDVQSLQCCVLGDGGYRGDLGERLGAV